MYKEEILKLMKDNRLAIIKAIKKAKREAKRNNTFGHIDIIENGDIKVWYSINNNCYIKRNEDFFTMIIIKENYNTSADDILDNEITYVDEYIPTKEQYEKYW